MPNFKPKANKKFKLNKKTATLDSKHNEKMQEFNKLYLTYESSYNQWLF